VGKPSLNAAQPYAKAEGRVFLLVPAYPGCHGTNVVKRLLEVTSNLLVTSKNYFSNIYASVASMGTLKVRKWKMQELQLVVTFDCISGRKLSLSSF